MTMIVYSHRMKITTKLGLLRQIVKFSEELLM